MPCREAVEALLRDQQGGVSGAAGGVASAVAAIRNPGPDFGYSLTTKSALFMCRGLAVSSIASGSSDPPPPAHTHAHGAAGSGSRLLRASAAPSAPPGVPDPISPASAFRLHSRRGAPHIMLLDFTGAPAQEAAAVGHGSGWMGSTRACLVSKAAAAQVCWPPACATLLLQGTPQGAPDGMWTTSMPRL